MKSKTVLKPVTLRVTLPVVDDVAEVNEEASQELSNNAGGDEDEQ